MANCCRTRSGGKAGLQYPFAQEVCRRSVKTASHRPEIRAPTRTPNVCFTNRLQRCAVSTQKGETANGWQLVAPEYTNERIRCARGCRTGSGGMTKGRNLSLCSTHFGARGEAKNCLGLRAIYPLPAWPFLSSREFVTGVFAGLTLAEDRPKHRGDAIRSGRTACLTAIQCVE